ncbi:hypothetical protein FHT17_003916 [Novosphingobium sp. SG916]|nr:hypothetical protein [Novosphingobium sp. SG720]NMN88997.1 hypothetical protein [Novosphingobium sp. SG916]
MLPRHFDARFGALVRAAAMIAATIPVCVVAPIIDLP